MKKCYDLNIELSLGGSVTMLRGHNKEIRGKEKFETHCSRI